MAPVACLPRKAPRARDAVTDARRRVSRTGNAETPGHVVAELTLAFWRNLVAARHHRSLWQPTLYRAFPGHSRQSVEHSLLWTR